MSIKVRNSPTMANGVRGGGTSLANVNKPRQKQKRKDTKLTSTSEAIVGSYLKVQRQKQKEQPFFWILRKVFLKEVYEGKTLEQSISFTRRVKEQIGGH